MGTHYSALSIDERTQIQLLLQQRCSCREISRQLHRSPSTITREIALNSSAPDTYIAAGAQTQRAQRRLSAKAASRKLGLAFDTPLGQHVRQRLEQLESPQQIAGRLKAMPQTDPTTQQPLGSASGEAIYQSIYVLPRGTLRTTLVDCLRRAHSKRMPRTRGKARSVIPNIVGIEQRPTEADSRQVPGHWEADFIKGAYNRSGVGTMIERTSRLVLLAHMGGCKAEDALEGFSRRLLTVPQELRKTLAYDRGVEMVLHEQLTLNTGIQVFFCDPHSPWQRACNENMNGLVRQYLPKGADLSTVSYQQLSFIEQQLNNRPRAILGFRTPLEVYQEILERIEKDREMNIQAVLAEQNICVAVQG